MEVASRGGLQHVAFGQSVLLPRRQAARLGRTERAQPQLQHKDIVDDESRVCVGCGEWQQRGDAAVLSVGLEAPLPRLVERRERGRMVVAHRQPHARVTRRPVLEAQVGGDVRALSVGAATPRMEQQRPAAAIELKGRRRHLAWAEGRKVAERPLVHGRALARRRAEQLDGTARLAQFGDAHEGAIDWQQLRSANTRGRQG